jgi:hypothetical protein
MNTQTPIEAMALVLQYSICGETDAQAVSKAALDAALEEVDKMAFRRKRYEEQSFPYSKPMMADQMGYMDGYDQALADFLQALGGAEFCATKWVKEHDNVDGRPGTLSKSPSLPVDGSTTC